MTTSKEFLEEYLKAGRRLRCIQMELMELRAAAEFPGGGFTGKIHSTPKSILDAVVPHIVDEERRLFAEMEKSHTVRRQVLRAIRQVKSEEHREVLLCLYVYGFTFEQTAEHLFCSLRTVYRRRDEALGHIKIPKSWQCLAVSDYDII